MTVFKRPSLKSLLLAATMLASPLIAAAPTPAVAQIAVGIALPGISVEIAPPILPVYEQPPMPAEGYMWTPGYWHWAEPTGYYWVPGTWVQPPSIGVLWTPPYWGWNNGRYVFNGGYWGPHIGFYGGVNYGFGYGGSGYEGGRWDGDHFAYNRTVNNFGSTRVTNVYERNVTVVNNNHVSYVGGTGGLRAEPTAAERVAAQDRHVAATTEQTAHITAAARNPELAASRNGGHPAIAATSRPAQFEGPGVVHAAPAGAAEHATAPGTAAHPAQAGAARPAPGQPAATNAAPTAAGAGHAAPGPHAVEAAPARPAAGQPAATNAATPHPLAAKPAPAPHAVEAAPAHPAPGQPAATNAAAPHPLAAKPAPAPHTAQAAPAHPAAVQHAAPAPHTAQAAPARPAPAHPVAAAAPRPAAAHPAPAEKKPPA